MSLRIRHLLLRVQTPTGMVGATMSFADGLNVIRADNTSGKSTCLQAIVYALGLEGMWGPSRDVPLAHVVTHNVDVGLHSLPVVWSDVLEISNGKDVLTVRRVIKSSGTNVVETGLVSTWNGPLLSEPRLASTLTQQDFFVREPGAATSTSGFHGFLSKFIGWQLPAVPRFQGGESPLYMEAIFPLLFVEQKKGWSTIPARFPTYLQIREVGRRVVEFLLRLDSYEIEASRQRLKDEEADLKQRWRASVVELNAMARTVGAAVQGLPNEPLVAWPPLVPIVLLFPRNGEWVRLSSVLQENRSRLAVLASQPIPLVGQVVGEATVQLSSLEADLAKLEFAVAANLEDFQSERLETQRALDRVASLDEELKRVQDAKKLVRLGSVQKLKLAENHCPACDQPLADTLASQRVIQNIMSLEDNEAYLKEQREIVSAMYENGVKRTRALELEVSAIRIKADTARSQIRSIRSTLVSSNTSPSVASIQERLELEGRVRKMTEVEQDLAIRLESVGRMVAEWNSIAARKAAFTEFFFFSVGRTENERFPRTVCSSREGLWILQSQCRYIVY